jgi:hypothetical protein
MTLRTTFLKILFSINLLIGSWGISVAQETGLKGNVMIFWGWNRGWFTDSDIRFTGENYDFTLYDVKASDRQTPFSADTYLNPANMTIPQTNFRAGYFITDHYCITGGFDHMKYVMVQNQTVEISGKINIEGSPYNDEYNHSDIVLTESFLQYEHTNGLNYINVGLSRFDRIVNIQKFRTAIYFTEGCDAGFLMPRTAVRFMNHELSDYYHVAGYGFNIEAGLNILIFKVVTIRSELKGGFIGLPDVKTSNSNADKAHQHFFFLQSNILFGATIPLFARKK